MRAVGILSTPNATSETCLVDIGTLATGALGALVLKEVFDRRREQRAARRGLVDASYRTMQQFWNSYTMRSPIEVDENGFYIYGFAQMKAAGEEGGQTILRLALGRLDTQLGIDVDALADQIRKEMHGRWVK